MSEQLIIYLDHQRAEDGVAWARVNAKSKTFLQEGFSPVNALAEKAQGAGLVVLLPAGRVSLLSAHVPSKNINTVRVAVPNVLEEFLSDPISELYFALGVRQADMHYPVAVLSKSYMAQTVAFLNEQQLYPRHIVPSVMALPMKDGAWSVGLDDQDALVRTGDYTGFVSRKAHLELYLTQAKADVADIQASEAEPNRHAQSLKQGVESTPSDSDSDVADGLSEPVSHDAQQPEPTRVDQRIPLHVFVKSDHDDALEDWTFDGFQTQIRDGRSLIRLFSEGWLTTPNFNLLQGEYKPQKMHSARLKKWRTTLVLGSVLLLAWMGGYLFDTIKKATVAAQDEAKIEALYRSLFPTGNLVNVEVQLQDKLNRLKSSGQTKGDFLSTLDSALTAFAFDSSAQVEKIAYRESALELELRVQDNKSLETIRQRIEKSGYLSEIIGSELKDNAVVGRIKVQQ